MDIQKEAIGADIPVAIRGDPASVATGTNDIQDEGDGEANQGPTWKPLERSIDDELDEAGDDATRMLRERQRAMFDALDLTR